MRTETRVTYYGSLMARVEYILLFRSSSWTFGGLAINAGWKQLNEGGCVEVLQVILVRYYTLFALLFTLPLIATRTF